MTGESEIPPAYARYRATRFFASLDGLRAVSILSVIWFHTWFVSDRYAWLAAVPVLRMGWFGVDVFFAISGFLITTLLLRERDRHGTISLRDFYIRRALRIWPLYYAVLGLYVVLVAVTERGTARGAAFFGYLPTYLTFTFTWFGPRPGEQAPIFNFAWSLSTEEQFYLFWPFAVRFLRWPWTHLLMCGVAAVGLAATYDLLDHPLGPGSLAARVARSIAVPICLGALLGQALHSARGFRAMYPVLGRRWSAPAAVALLIVCLIPVDPRFRPAAWLALPFVVGACVVREDHGLSAVLRWRPAAHIGVLSYGMYLLNTLVVKVASPALGRAGVRHPVLVFPVVVGGTALLAWISFRYFESPFLRLKGRFARLHPPPAAAADDGIKSAATGEPVHP